MKNAIQSIIAIALATSLSVHADAKPQRHTDIAKVTHVQAVYSQVKHRVPTENCWVETVREERPIHNRKSSTPALIGGIVGGVLGNEIAQGDTKRIGSVVGTVLGMSIANDIQNKHNRNNHGYEVSYRDVQRCETSYHVESQRILKGYDVRYRYKGREYTTFSKKHPGKNIRVAVNVSPARR